MRGKHLKEEQGEENGRYEGKWRDNEDNRSKDICVKEEFRSHAGLVIKCTDMNHLTALHIIMVLNDLVIHCHYANTLIATTSFLSEVAIKSTFEEAEYITFRKILQ